MKRTALVRRTPLRSVAPLKAKRPGRSKAEVSGRALVRARSGGRCERNCLAAATEYHHRKFRSQGGDWSPANALHLCSAHHQWITEHPAASYANGWSCRSTVDPAAMPVLRRGVWVWLTASGEAIPLEFKEIEEWAS